MFFNGNSHQVPSKKYPHLKRHRLLRLMKPGLVVSLFKAIKLFMRTSTAKKDTGKKITETKTSSQKKRANSVMMLRSWETKLWRFTLQRARF